MILFKSITYQNFTSTGAMPITVDLDRSPNTLVTGLNGSGKSSATEALVYCLFGKAYRKVPVGNLINNKNGKKLLTTCIFEKGGQTHKVVRGQKPAVFEIYVDDVLVESEAAKKDYQKHLEQVLGMDYKVFTQVVVLNKARFQPFMTLGAGDRRFIVENILDCTVFTTMNNLAKRKIKELDKSIYDKNHEYELLTKEIEKLESLIEFAQQSNDELLSKLQGEQIDLKTQLRNKATEAKSLVEERAAIKFDREEYERLLDEKENIKMRAVQTKSALDSLLKDLAFFDNTSVCPTCKQDIDEERISDHLGKLDSTKEGYEGTMGMLKDKGSEVVSKLKEIQALKDTHDRITSDIGALKQDAGHIKQQLNKVDKEIEDASKQGTSIEKEKADLKEAFTKRDGTHEEYQKLLSAKARHEYLHVVLKDNGIKAKIIDSFIPVINNYINEYLKALNFYINFELDNQFNETVLLPSKNDFRYTNFSDGQKTRIDIAILLSLITIARQKNSVSTNLLVLDEVLENIDAEGVVDFLGLMRTKFEGTNLFVVSQRGTEFSDLFRANIKFEQDDYDFTRIAK